jgi:hypothetical protein
MDSIFEACTKVQLHLDMLDYDFCTGLLNSLFANFRFLIPVQLLFYVVLASSVQIVLQSQVLVPEVNQTRRNLHHNLVIFTLINSPLQRLHFMSVSNSFFCKKQL